MRVVAWVLERSGIHYIELGSEKRIVGEAVVRLWVGRNRPLDCSLLLRPPSLGRVDL